jgi:hypothetical protein
LKTNDLKANNFFPFRDKKNRRREEDMKGRRTKET